MRPAIRIHVYLQHYVKPEFMYKSSLDSQGKHMYSATRVVSCSSPGINPLSGVTWPSSCCFIGQLESEAAPYKRPQASKKRCYDNRGA